MVRIHYRPLKKTIPVCETGWDFFVLNNVQLSDALGRIKKHRCEAAEQCLIDFGAYRDKGNKIFSRSLLTDLLLFATTKSQKKSATGSTQRSRSLHLRHIALL